MLMKIKWLFFASCGWILMKGKLQSYKLTSKMNILYVMLFNLELFLDVVINQNMLYEN